MFLIIFDLEPKRGVEFRHSTRNFTRIRRKMENELSKHYGPSAYSIVSGIRVRERVTKKIFVQKVLQSDKNT